MNGKYLITTDAYFLAPDGKEYKAAWGEVEILNDSFLGIKTNARSSNWFAKIGSEYNHIIIAGCQIHYAIKCINKPNTSKAESWTFDAANGAKEFVLPTKIYIAE